MKAHDPTRASGRLISEELLTALMTLGDVREEGREVIVEYKSGFIVWILLTTGPGDTRAEWVAGIKGQDVLIGPRFHLTTPRSLEPVWRDEDPFPLQRVVPHMLMLCVGE